MTYDDARGIRLNLGCGGRPLPGYVNIDLDSLEQMKHRYPTYDFDESIPIHQYDIFNLPYNNATVSEVRAESLLEHLAFDEERQLFVEIQRVLHSGAVFQFSVPDFEFTVRQWLNAEDNWQDFYRNDEDAIRTNHWFGQYSTGADSRWGYLTAIIFGLQNSPGQFHKNCYTEKKIETMLAKLGFHAPIIKTSSWKGNDIVRMLNVTAEKK